MIMKSYRRLPEIIVSSVKSFVGKATCTNKYVESVGA